MAKSAMVKRGSMVPDSQIAGNGRAPTSAVAVSNIHKFETDNTTEYENGREKLKEDDRPRITTGKQ